MRRSTSSLALAVLLPALAACSGSSSAAQPAAPVSASQPSSASTQSPVASTAARVPALGVDQLTPIPGYTFVAPKDDALPAAVVEAGPAPEGTVAQDLTKDGAAVGSVRLLRYPQGITEDALGAALPAIVEAVGGTAATPIDVRGDSAVRAGGTVGLRIGWDVYLLTSPAGPDAATTLAQDFISGVD